MDAPRSVSDSVSTRTEEGEVSQNDVQKIIVRRDSESLLHRKLFSALSHMKSRRDGADYPAMVEEIEITHDKKDENGIQLLMTHNNGRSSRSHITQLGVFHEETEMYLREAFHLPPLQEQSMHLASQERVSGSHTNPLNEDMSKLPLNPNCHKIKSVRRGEAWEKVGAYVSMAGAGLARMGGGVMVLGAGSEVSNINRANTGPEYCKFNNIKPVENRRLYEVPLGGFGSLRVRGDFYQDFASLIHDTQQAIKSKRTMEAEAIAPTATSSRAPEGTPGMVPNVNRSPSSIHSEAPTIGESDAAALRDATERVARMDAVELRHLDVNLYKKLAILASGSSAKITIQDGRDADGEVEKESHRYNIYLEKNSSPTDVVEKLNAAVKWERGFNNRKGKSVLRGG